MTLEVIDLQWDDDGEEHVAKHGLSVAEVAQVVANGYVIVKNRKARRAQYVMLGTTDGGRDLAVPIRRTRDLGTWRVVTAYDASDAQRQVLKDNRK